MAELEQQIDEPGRVEWTAIVMRLRWQWLRVAGRRQPARDGVQRAGVRCVMSQPGWQLIAAIEQDAGADHGEEEASRWEKTRRRAAHEEGRGQAQEEDRRRFGNH